MTTRISSQTMVHAFRAQDAAVASSRGKESYISALRHVVMIGMALVALFVQLMPGVPMPSVHAATGKHGGKQAPAIKSKMQSHFAQSTLSGTNCASSSISPLIFNCGVSGVINGSATVVWESDVQAPATVCVNSAAYSAGQCQLQNGNQNPQCDHNWGPNPGFTALDNVISKQQLPDGNWVYATVVPLSTPGTYHYQISMQLGSSPVQSSNDESFAAPTMQPNFQDSFGGATTASTPYFSESWSGAQAVASGPALFQDSFSSASILSSNWQVVSGSWAVNAAQGVATASGAGEAYETPAQLGSTAGTGEMVTSITLPALTSQYTYDDAGVVIYEDLSSQYGGKVLFILDTTVACQTSGTGCSAGELASGLWLTYKDPGSGATKAIALSPGFTNTFTTGTQYTFDVRVSGRFVSVFDRTAPTNPWQFLTSAEATTSINGVAYTISKGQSGIWNNATSATPVQFGAFNLYATPTVPASVASDPSSSSVEGIFNPNSTTSQGTLVAAATTPLGVPVSQGNDEVDFSSDSLGGIVARSDTTGAGDTFSISLSPGTITGQINSAGSDGQVTGNAPWQLEARFDGSNLSLYAQASGSSTWTLLASGYSSRTTAGYVWPLPTATGTLGTFSLRQITIPALVNWVTSGSYPSITTTAESPNAPGQMLLKSINGSSMVTTNNVSIGDGTLMIPFYVYNPDVASIAFRVRSIDYYYKAMFYQPFTGSGVRLIRVTPSPYKHQPDVQTTIGSFASTCNFYLTPGPYTAYISLISTGMCVAFGPGLWGAPVAETCASDPAGWTGGGVGLEQDQADVAMAGIRYFSGNDPQRWFGPDVSVSGAGIGSGTYSETATDLAFPGNYPQAQSANSSTGGGSPIPSIANVNPGLPLAWSRTYSSSAAAQNILSPLGVGWSTSYTRTLTINGDSSVSITTANGSLETFAYDTANSSYTPPRGVFDTLIKNADGSYTLSTRTRTTSTFRTLTQGGPGVLTSQTDADGNTTNLSYGANTTLTSVTDPVGRQLRVTYNISPIGSLAAGTLIASVTDGTRTVTYGYDTGGNLTSVTDADGNITTYVYDSALNPHLLTKRYDANNQPGVVTNAKFLQNVYAVDSNYDPTHFKYTPSGGFRLTEQIDPLGAMTHFSYDAASGNALSGTFQVTRDAGDSSHLNEVATYQLNSQGLVTSFTDPLGTLTQYTYDASGQLTQEVVDAGQGHLNLTWQRVYDTFGNLVETVDPNGRSVAFSYGTNPTTSDFQQITQVVVDPVPPSGGAHLNATYTVAYYPQSSAPSGFVGNSGDVYSVTDPMNGVSRFSYNTRGEVTRSQDADGRYTSYAYDALGQLTQSVTDPSALDPGGLNLTTTFQFDTLGRLVKQTDPMGVSTTYTYDNLLRLTQVVADPFNAITNPQGLNLVTTYTYDKVGNVTSTVVDPTPSNGVTCTRAYGGRYIARCHMNETTTNVYDANNRLIHTTSPINGSQVVYPGASSITTLSGVTTYSYDAVGDQVSATDPVGHVTTMAYDADSHLARVTNPLNGQKVTYPDGTVHTYSGTTTYTRDAAGRVTQVIDPLGLITKYTYDQTADITQVVVDPIGAGLTQTRTYDSAGRLATTTDARNDITSYAYDADNHVIEAQAPLGEQTTKAYDPMGRVTSEMLDPLPQGQTSGHANVVTQYVYDAAGRLTSATRDPNTGPGTVHLNLTAQFTYDGDGRVLTAVDPNNHTTKYSYDHLGRQLTVTDPHAVATNGPSWRFVYDYLGNVRQQTDPLGHITTTLYDALNRPVQQIVDPNPVGGTGHLQLTSSQYFDSAGDVAYSENANKRTTAFGYDALNRLTQVTYHSAVTPDVTYYYDDSGNRVYMTDGSGAQGTYWKATYDLMGRLSSLTDPSSNQMSYAYDENGYAGQLTTITYPSGHSLAMTYDLDGRPDTLSSPNNALFGAGTSASTTTFQYTYDSAGRPSQLTYPNGVTATVGYDTAGRPTQENAVGTGGATVANWSEQLDNDGNPTQVTDSTVSGTHQTTYTYDEGNRLLTANYWDGTSQTYTYDAAGNRTTMSSGGSPVTYTYDAAGRLTSSGAATYGYDNDGNRISATVNGTTTSYAYDQADRMISTTSTAGTTSYTYDGNGQRVSKTSTTGYKTLYTWDPLSGSLLSDGTTEYVASASGGLLVQTPAAGGANAALYGVPDNLGSTRVLSNQSGQTQATYAYDAFGNVKSSTSSGGASSSLGFAGQLTDAETGFQDLRARQYDPSTGQFLGRDTYAGSSSSATSLNRYAYAGNTPTTFTDPSGHCSYNSDCSANEIVDNCPDVGVCGGTLDSGGSGGGLFNIPGIVGFFVNLIPGLGAFLQSGVGQFLTNLVIGFVVAAVIAPIVEVGVALLGIAGAAAFVLTNAGIGAGVGVFFQVMSNVMNGRAWDAGLGMAALKGAALGVLFGGLFEGLGSLGKAFLGLDGGGVGALDGLDTLGSDFSALDTGGADASGGGADTGGSCSFSPNTQVATPSGEKAIGSLHVGDTVTAYNPTTGQAETEPVQHVWVNHDHDLVDVGLTTATTTTPDSASSSGSFTSASGKPSSLTQQVGHVVRTVAALLTLTTAVALPASAHAALASASSLSAQKSASIETIHTTANHPWLTTDRGWVPAGELRSGERVVTLSGNGTSTVAWVYVVPGQSDMYNLTVAHDHTFAVGTARDVVHNECIDPSVWDRITPQGPNRLGTEIPEVFNLETDAGSFRVMYNATEHMGEYIQAGAEKGFTVDPRDLPGGIRDGEGFIKTGPIPEIASPLRSQVMLGSFTNSVDLALQSGLVPGVNNFGVWGDWELGIGMGNMHIYHARLIYP